MISIVIPLYNKANKIRCTLESVLSQTYQEYEIIIVNDGSTDSSAEVVSVFSDKRIYLIHQDNQGVSVARNRGIMESKYEYIAFLDADDEWKPTYLESMVTLIRNYSECGVFASAYKLKDSSGNISNIVLKNIPFEGNTGILTNYFKIASDSHPPVWTSAVIVKKNCIIKVGGFPVGIKAGEDLLTWAKLAINYQIAYCRNAYAVFNFPENVSQRESRLKKGKDIVFEELKKLYQVAGIQHRKGFRAYLGRWNEMRAAIFIDSGSGIYSLMPALRALRYKGFTLKIMVFILLSFFPGKLQRTIINYIRKKI